MLEEWDGSCRVEKYSCAHTEEERKWGMQDRLIPCNIFDAYVQGSVQYRPRKINTSVGEGTWWLKCKEGIGKEGDAHTSC